MTTILFILAGGVLIISALALLYSVIHAPSGHEDAEGFHVDEPAVVVRPRPEIPEPAREPHSLSA